MDTAVKCVEYLKKSNIGCATFIGLDKVRRGLCRLMVLFVCLFVCVCFFLPTNDV